MPQIINTNIASLNAQRNLNRTGGQLETSLQRLSTGLRINSARDDAAGLAISERFTTQIRGLNQAIRNANDGISFAQTAEGALSTVGDSLQRIRELAVQSINDTNSTSDRAALNNEVTQLIAEVNRIANATQFNGQNVLDGSLSNLTFQVGANQGQTITVSGVDARGTQLGAAFDTGASVSSNDITVTAAGDLTDITLNGVTVDLSTVDSLAGVVNAINESTADTGVQAIRAATTNTLDQAGAEAITYASTTDANVLTINNVAISIAASTSEADLVTAINDRSAQTGVTVEGDGAGGLNFTDTNGGDIVISETGTQFTGEGTFSAGYLLATDVGQTITVGGTDAADLGLDAIAVSDATLNTTSVLTGSDANDALLTLDFALQQVNGLRAELGAVQTRFESTISNLSVTSENLSAARSRIRDADFAAETAELTRTQILQQAGISILAQANVLPQSALALLQ